MVALSHGVPVRGDLDELELALMCEKFHKLPSEVMAEPGYMLRRVWAILAERDRITKPKKKGKR